MARDLPQRACCDGGCDRGLPCPAFAPGVIDGPHRRATWWRRFVAWLAGAC